MQRYSKQMEIFEHNGNKYIYRRKIQMKLNQYYQRIIMKIFLIQNWNKLFSLAKIQYMKKIKRKIFCQI